MFEEKQDRQSPYWRVSIITIFVRGQEHDPITD